jgi:hypothetical protein
MNPPDRKSIWQEIRGHKNRKVTPEQLEADIEIVRDEVQEVKRSLEGL